MDILPSQSKVNVKLFGVDAKKSAIFNMAFKMHSIIQFNLVDSVVDADILVVDADSIGGEQLWEKTINEYQNIPRIYSSVFEPTFDVAYLPKPIKVEILFPVLRAALSGDVTFKYSNEPVEKNNHKVYLSFKDQSKNYRNTLSDTDEISAAYSSRNVNFPVEKLQYFDGTIGLLGVTRKVVMQKFDAAIILDNKPVLMFFADIDKILLAISPDKLERLCLEGCSDFEVKRINHHPEWKEHAKVSIETCLWQFSIWSSRGRVLAELNLNKTLQLKSWPNITRMAYIPNAMRMSAFLSKAPVPVSLVYKMINVEFKDLLDFISASYVIGLLKIDGNSSDTIQQFNNSTVQNQAMTSAKSNSVTAIRTQHSISLLQRLLKKLTGK